MQKKLQPKGIIFLLGAGASQEAGIPTSAEMLERLRHARHPQEALLAKLERIRRFSNIEDLLLTLDNLNSSADSQVLAPFVKDWLVPLRSTAFRSSVIQLRDYVLRRLYGWLKPGRDYSYLAKVYDFGSSGKPSKKKRHSVDVFTLNYDLGVEMACESQSIPIWTGYEQEHFEQLTPVLSFDEWVFDNAGVCLYKLHGSSNWGVMKSRKSEKPQFSSVVGAMRKIFDNRPFSFRKDSWLPAEDRARGFYLDAFSGPMIGMIFGTRDKALSYQPFITLQEAFNVAVGRAKALFVLGYNWSDPYLNLRIERERERGLFVADVVRDAAKACNEPRRRADVFIGKGVKAALNRGNVQVALRTRNGSVETSADGGLVGALKMMPTLYRQNRRCFRVPQDEFDQGINGSERFLKQLLRESYTRGIVR
jgi:SIR2-like domain